jgi:hypothetical protein
MHQIIKQDRKGRIVADAGAWIARQAMEQDFEPNQVMVEGGRA